MGTAVVLWNAAVMPRAAVEVGPDAPGSRETPDDPRSRRPSVSYFVGARARVRSAPLFLAAFGVGFASAVYWTFSRDLVVSAGHLGQTGSTLFWTAIGVSGLLGGAAGDLAGRFGLAAVMRGALTSMAAAIALLAVAPGTLPLAYASAALFGSTYIALTGALLVWSVDVFRERPSAGLGAAFLLIAVGQLAGSPGGRGHRGGIEPGGGLLRVRARGGAHRPGEAAHRRPRRFRARPLRSPAAGASASAATSKG